MASGILVFPGKDGQTRLVGAATREVRFDLTVEWPPPESKVHTSHSEHDLSAPWAELLPDGSLLLTVDGDGERWKLWDSNALEVFGEPLRKKERGCVMGKPLRWGRCDTPQPTATFSPCGKKFAISQRGD